MLTGADFSIEKDSQQGGLNSRPTPYEGAATIIQYHWDIPACLWRYWHTCDEVYCGYCERYYTAVVSFMPTLSVVQLRKKGDRQDWTLDSRPTSALWVAATVNTTELLIRIPAGAFKYAGLLVAVLISTCRKYFEVWDLLLLSIDTTRYPVNLCPHYPWFN